ncbi:MAG: DNA internalization-related competence protein ComEC/Rec2 [Oceanicoccus sp.]
MMAISLGIAAVAFVPHLPTVSQLGWLIALSAVVLSVQRKAILLVLFVAGFCWGSIYGITVSNSIIPVELESKALLVTGTVVGLPRVKLSRGKPALQFELAVTKPVCYEEHCVSGIKRLKLTAYDTEEILPGQTWQLLVKLKRPHGMANPGGFDYQSWLIQQGIGGVGYVRSHSDNQLVCDNRWSLHRLRWVVSAAMDRQIGHLPFSSLLKALLIGDKRAIDKRQWDLFAATGTTHLMVISGLHIGLVSGFVFLFVRFLFAAALPWYRAEFWAALAAVGCALIYALAAGFTLPTQRALIMIIVGMLTIIFQRNIAPNTGFGIALTGCLIVDPLAVLSLSFWLSFSAVFIIFYSATGRLGSIGGPGKWLSTQLWVFIGLLPVLAILLGRTSFLAPLANVILVPLFSIILVPFNLIAGIVAMGDGDIAVEIWWWLNRGLVLVNRYLEWLVGVGHQGIITVPGRPLTISILVVIGVFVLLLPKGVPLKWMGAILLLPLFLYQPSQLPEGDVKFTVLDVGQGLATIIQTRNYTLVYDVGARWGEDFDMAQAAVIPYLQREGIGHIESLVISHGDNDHAGSLPSILTSMLVSELYLGEPLEQLETSQWDGVTYNNVAALQKPCVAGTQWQRDAVTFQFLHPDVASRPSKRHAALPRRNANNHSCVLRISAGNVVMLLTGDIESSVELALIGQKNGLLAATVLVAPHHGSRTSSSWPFVKKSDPKYVIFSSGYRNQFSHPHKEIVGRYRSVGSTVLTTATSGAIEFYVREGKLGPPHQYRLSVQHYWL